MINTDISNLLTFISVADCGSFTKAAEELNVSQSSVSKHVKALEDEYGVRLLRREHGSVFVTEAGDTFCRLAHELLLVSDELKTAMNEFKLNRKSVTLNSTYPTANYGFIRRINQFQKDYPDIYVNINEYDSLCIQKLRAKSCDIAIFGENELSQNEDISFLEHYYIMSDRYVAVMHKSNMLSEKKEITIDALIKHRLYILQAHKKTMSIALPAIWDHYQLDAEYFVNIPPIIERLADSRGVSILPEKALMYFEPKDVVTVPIIGQEKFEVYIGWLRERRNVERIKNIRKYFIDISN